MFMSETGTIPLFVRLVCSFLAAFPAIAIWSRSRDAEWVLMALGAVLFFVDALYATLVNIGIATYERPWAAGFPLLQSLLTGMPVLFFAAGFMVFLLRNRRY